MHLFTCSGSGLISDQPSGTSFQMQRGLNLISSDKLGKGKTSVFKRIIFLQPAIPSIPYPTETTRMKERPAMLNIEMSNASRLLALNSCAGNYQLKTFLSSTESVMVEELGETTDDVRRWLTF